MKKFWIIIKIIALIGWAAVLTHSVVLAVTGIPINLNWSDIIFRDAAIVAAMLSFVCAEFE